MTTNVDDPWQEWKASQSDNPLHVGVVYAGLSSSQGCGHQFRISKLNEYLRDCRAATATATATATAPTNTPSQGTTTTKTKTTTTPCCPICHEPIVLIEDGVVEKKKDSVVFFKYGKLHYCLSLEGTTSMSTVPWFWYPFLPWYTSTTRTIHSYAQERIATFLNIKLMHVRILSKGKVVYPDLTKSQNELSQILVAISQASLSTSNKHMDNSKSSNIHSSKPSLVVMGTPMGQELSNPHSVGLVTWTGAIIYSWFNSMLQWGYHLVIVTPWSLFRLLRSAWSASQPQHQD